MSKELALLSGKGGSGKTTLALSIAAMLAECSLKVLLVDCDLSTNGATYFYESKLSEKENSIVSFYGIFVEKDDTRDRIIHINKNMDFMPSITKITKDNYKTYQYNETDLEEMEIIDKKLRAIYDVIIYDCQAGYTDILKLLLPYVDVNLVVMEADAISSAAIRSFYLKIGDLMNKKKTYQIFNKATDEEYKIYSKISGGTIFTNIETVMFDWKIRKAFSIAQIPDMEETSAKYGEQIYNICKILFNEDKIQEKIQKYNVIIKLNKVKEQERLLESAINKQKTYYRNIKSKVMKTMYVAIIPMIFVAALKISMQLLDVTTFQNKINNVTYVGLLAIIQIIAIVIAIISLNDITKERRSQIRKINMTSEELDKILATKKILENKLKEIEGSDKSAKVEK